MKTACIYYQVDRMLLNIKFFSIIYRHIKNMHWVQQIIISFPNLHWLCHVWFNILAWSIQLSLIFLSWYGMTSTLIDGTNLLRKHWSTFFLFLSIPINDPIDLKSYVFIFTITFKELHFWNCIRNWTEFHSLNEMKFPI